MVAHKELPKRVRVLVVEDEYLIAVGLVKALEKVGADVIGPCSTVETALAELNREHIDAAILDINLQRGTVFPVARLLRAEGIPFIFASGYERSVIPEEFADVPHLGKPKNPDAVLETLTVAFPRMRRT